MKHTRSWLHFICNIFLANLGLLKKPFRLFLVVTTSCGSRCQNCKIWTKKPLNELTLEDYSKIAENSRSLSWLNISGGEPTDRNDLPQIIQIFKEKCPNLLFVNFTTNGINSEKIIQQVIEISKLEIPWFNVNVSIDGPANIHDQLRGISGNFESAIKTLQGIQNISGIRSGASMTLFNENKSLINETLNAINKEIPSFDSKNFHINIPHQSEHYYRNHLSNNLGLNGLSEAFKIHKIKRIFSFDKIIENIFRKKANFYFKSQRSPIPCSALMSSAYISQTGEVFPCTIWNKKVGNLKDFNWDISKLIHSNEGLQIRNEIKKLNCPNCWTPCEAFTSIMSNLKSSI